MVHCAQNNSRISPEEIIPTISVTFPHRHLRKIKLARAQWLFVARIKSKVQSYQCPLVSHKHRDALNHKTPIPIIIKKFYCCAARIVRKLHSLKSITEEWNITQYFINNGPELDNRVYILRSSVCRLMQLDRNIYINIARMFLSYQTLHESFHYFTWYLVWHLSCGTIKNNDYKSSNQDQGKLNYNQEQISTKTRGLYKMYTSEHM